MQSILPMFALLAVVVVGMFFISSRQRKQQGNQTAFRDSLVAGQQVMTSSGQLGTVVEVVGDAVTIETTPGVQTRWVKAAIQAVPPQWSSVLGGSENEDDDLDDETTDGETPEVGEDRPERPTV